MKTSRKWLLCAALAVASAAAQAAFPEKPIQVVVPFSAGGISDLAARLVADKMQARLGQPVIVENKPGAAGMIGASDVAHARPDGYRILLGSNSTNAINSSIYAKMSYDIAGGFAPISLAGEIPSVLVARRDFPAASVAQAIEYARSKPGTVSFANGNTTGRVSGETLNRMAPGMNMINVQYKGEPNGMKDVLGGQVDLMFLNLPVAYPNIVDGRVKALGLPGGARVQELPDVPLIGETVPGYEIPNGWLAFFAPAGTPPEIVDALNGAIVSALADPEVKAKLKTSGGYIVKSSTPAELAERVRSEIGRWAELVSAAGIPKQ